MAETEPNYCYRCGKHVRKGGLGACWYCHAPIRRAIRPARRCRYCDEEIGAKALKCPHCGEFQDEGPSSRDLRLAQLQARAQAAQITYVIDKAVIQGEQPLMLRGGQPVPPEVSPLLTQRTVRAIELNKPDMIDQQGIKALPAPKPVSPTADSAEPVVIDAASGGSAEGSARAEPGSAGGALVRVDPDKNLPALSDVGESSRPRSLLERLADFALSRFEEPTEPQGEPIQEMEPVDTEETEEAKYRECTVCHTEVLAQDSYCFHCGTTLRSESQQSRSSVRRPADGSSAAGRHFLSLFFMAGSLALNFVSFESLGLGEGGFEGIGHLAGAALLLATLAILLSTFWRRRTSASQLITLILLVAWLGCVWFSAARLFGGAAA
ncbi:hypothetical protein JW916_16705 [Candidatus Sumerlaeota bacterium]|nr:hypothetical protein [Candidatus Sumerlaeota bacterium]